MLEEKDKNSFADYKKDFPWFENNKGLVYLDNAATTLKPRCMIEAESKYYTTLSANPHSDNKLAVQVYDQMQQTRKLLAEYIDADPEEVMFTSGSTEAINVVANAMQDVLHEGDEVIVSYLEHAANLLPWFKLRERKGVKLVFIGADSVIISPEMVKAALTNKTKVVAITGASNLLAIDYDIKGIVQAVKAFNKDILVSIDSTQYIEHYPLKCHEFGVDFAVGSSHKMCGPTGCGFLYLKKPGPTVYNPLRYGGDMNEEIYEDHFTFAHGNHKFEGGTPNAAGLFAWKESLMYLSKVGYKEMRRKEIALKTYFMEHMPKKNGLVILNPEVTNPLITIVFKDKEGKFVSTSYIEKFLADRNILARSGLSEANLIPKTLKVQSVVRISMLFYNDFEDMDRLIHALSELSAPNA